MSFTFNSYVAIKPPKNDKVEAKVTGGFAQAVQKTEVVLCDIVMDFYSESGFSVKKEKTKAIIAGDAVFKPWAKKIYTKNEESFVLCPFAEIIGFEEIES